MLIVLPHRPLAWYRVGTATQPLFSADILFSQRFWKLAGCVPLCWAASGAIFWRHLWLHKAAASMKKISPQNI